MVKSWRLPAGSTVMVIGSGPIVIGQACEFDYSGTQAAKVLRAKGYRVILVNSNPATIMTDPEFADATYIEPITPEVVTEIIARERPDALLPTLGGQTALNVASTLARSGVLDRHGPALEQRADHRDVGELGVVEPAASACQVSGAAEQLHGDLIGQPAHPDDRLVREAERCGAGDQHPCAVVALQHGEDVGGDGSPVGDAPVPAGSAVTTTASESSPAPSSGNPDARHPLPARRARYSSTPRGRWRTRPSPSSA